MKKLLSAAAPLLLIAMLLPGHLLFAGSAQERKGAALRVLAVETFLADIARNVAGDRLIVDALLPLGADPHSFDPTPADVTKVADCNVLIINGAGLEEFLDELLHNAGGTHVVIDASAGLQKRTPGEGEEGEAGDDHDQAGGGQHAEHQHSHKGEADHEAHHHYEAGAHRHHHHEGDPHFWLSPQNVIGYVHNIRDGLSQADPDGKAVYAANADRYIAQLEELDRWIAGEVSRIPEERRLLVTNHESFGYFADRYGFRVIGTIIPSVSTGASPSAQQLAHLIDGIKATGAQAVFLETGSNPQLARQVAKGAKVKLVEQLYTHSISGPDGPAPNYIGMMKYNTTAIVGALQ